MKEARELMEGLFTEQEETDFQFEQEDTQVKWKVKKDEGCQKHNRELWTDEWKEMFPEDGDLPDVPCTCIPIPQERDIPVSDGLKAKIGKFLTQLDKEEKLGFEHYSLCEKFGLEKASP
jgi:hypothetical protein